MLIVGVYYTISLSLSIYTLSGMKFVFEPILIILFFEPIILIGSVFIYTLSGMKMQSWLRDRWTNFALPSHRKASKKCGEGFNYYWFK
jgi:hypothetical protein